MAELDDLNLEDPSQVDPNDLEALLAANDDVAPTTDLTPTMPSVAPTAPVAAAAQPAPDALAKTKAAEDAADAQTQSLNADRIHDATIAGNKQEMMANLLRSFQGALKSAAPNTGFNPDNGVADSLSKSAKEPLENAKLAISQAAAAKKAKEAADLHRAQMDQFQQKANIANLNWQDMKANADP